MSARAILLAGIAAISPAAAAHAAPAASLPAAFAPPEDPVMISRTVVRSLFDGKEVRATRRYLVWFRPEADGWRIEGELRDVIVEVPPALEQFAGLERNRTEPGFFPILLDSSGHLKPRAKPRLGDGSRARAAAVGEMMIAGATTSLSARNQANAMLTQVVMAGNNGTAWPEDLFNPAQAETLETRGIALPDGSRGKIEIAVRAAGLAPGNLPAQVERIVRTDLGATRRNSREIWTFELLKP
ncbi:MAG: hypothetical protein EBR34_00535 [Sphingomonadaceae bacterium]|nr:hypothetical protein [Sphingomonadaceae bacterium]